MNAGTREHAVVLGASMAGLLAAKVPARFRDFARHRWPFGQHRIAVRWCHQTA
jgi:hypothetical protein